MGIETVKDLVFCFPTRYEDWSLIKPLNELYGFGEATVRVRIKKISNRRSPRRKIQITEAIISDGNAKGTAIWFNQPYLVKNLMPGTMVWLSGKFKMSFAGPSFTSPTYEIVRAEQVHTGRIIPIYGSLGGVPQKSFRRIMHDCLQVLAPQKEWLPEAIVKDNGLPEARSAFKEVHFPTDWQKLRDASKRFKFEELYLLSLRSELARRQIINEKSVRIPIQIPDLKKFIASLPFALTQSQRRAAWEIVQDLNAKKPMNRLLDGDVGSGKTAVAAIAAYSAAVAGGQTVIMAPTEILAKQHYATLSKTFKGHGVGIAILTRTAAQTSETPPQKNAKDRDRLLASIQEGRTKILVGTHAILFEKIKFKNLALAIVDEQHRFGVNQRHALKKLKGEKSIPHLLSMTATPIPRSLALAFYGDLDVSVLSEMPPGRKPARTVLVEKSAQPAAYEFIRDEIRQGRQAFVICPLIDPSDTLGVRSATAEYERLKKEIYPEIKIGLLHGKMKTEGKDKVMAQFKENKISILVSTAVVEVGVDVPNATAMIIEGAERFGLAQLHQFRGRIGRGSAPSSCFVFLENKNPLTYERLKIFAATADGFILAERDLALRGPGEIFGTMQSGISELKIASFADVEIASAARRAAREILALDKNLNTAPQVVAKLKEMEKNIHLE